MENFDHSSFEKAGIMDLERKAAFLEGSERQRLQEIDSENYLLKKQLKLIKEEFTQFMENLEASDRDLDNETLRDRLNGLKEAIHARNSTESDSKTFKDWQNSRRLLFFQLQSLDNDVSQLNSTLKRHGTLSGISNLSTREVEANSDMKESFECKNYSGKEETQGNNSNMKESFERKDESGKEETHGNNRLNRGEHDDQKYDMTLSETTLRYNESLLSQTHVMDEIRGVRVHLESIGRALITTKSMVQSLTAENTALRSGRMGSREYPFSCTPMKSKKYDSRQHAEGWHKPQDLDYLPVPPFGIEHPAVQQIFHSWTKDERKINLVNKFCESITRRTQDPPHDRLEIVNLSQEITDGFCKLVGPILQSARPDLIIEILVRHTSAIQVNIRKPEAHHISAGP